MTIDAAMEAEGRTKLKSEVMELTDTAQQNSSTNVHGEWQNSVYPKMDCLTEETHQATENILNKKKPNLFLKKPFQCDQCGASFTMMGNLNRHKRGHSAKRPFQCKFCMRGFLRRTSYVEHVRLHTGEKPYKCMNCLQQFARKKCYQLHSKKCGTRASLEDHNCSPVSSLSYEEEGPLDLSCAPSFQRKAKHLNMSLFSAPMHNPLSMLLPRPGLAALHFAYPDLPLDCSMSTAFMQQQAATAQSTDEEFTMPIPLSKENRRFLSGTPMKSSAHLHKEMHSLTEVTEDRPIWHCKHCDIYFGDCGAFTIHKNMHSDSNPLTCNLCSRICCDKHEFMTHHS